MSLKRKASTLPTTDAKKSKTITSFFGPPKPVTPTTKATATTAKGTGTTTEAIAAPASTWDKKKWVDKLTPEQKDLLVLEIETLHESWLKELKDEVTSASFLDLKRFLKKEHEAGKKIFPPAVDVYSWYLLPSALVPPNPTPTDNCLTGPATHLSTPSKL